MVWSLSLCRKIGKRQGCPHFIFLFILFFLVQDTNYHTCFLVGLRHLHDAQSESVLVHLVGNHPHFQCAEDKPSPTTRCSQGAGLRKTSTIQQLCIACVEVLLPVVIAVLILRRCRPMHQATLPHAVSDAKPRARVLRSERGPDGGGQWGT